MEGFSHVDRSTSPPTLVVPRAYNAAQDLLERRIADGDGPDVAVIDRDGAHTYAAVHERAQRAGQALAGLGIGLEDRVMMAMLDTVDFPAVFLGAIRLGAVPVPVNVLWTADDLAYALRDSRAKALVISAELLERLGPALEGQPFLRHVVVAGGAPGEHPRLDDLLAQASPRLDPAPTCADDIAFWLYSSGSTGTPKGVMHCHRHLMATAVLYGQGVLGIAKDDVVFSAAKLFFAYGLGNAMTFPFSVGATAVLRAERPTPALVMEVLRAERPTIYYGVPTLYAAILADPANTRERGAERLRRCVSAGEALPEEVGRRWEERFGVEILDGLGSTELLHIFLSNRPGDVRYGASGRPVPGYDLRIVDEQGRQAEPGELGELHVRGPSSAFAYWNQRDKTRHTFRGEWTATGDKYTRDEAGVYTYGGRADDMMKVSGQWVSPFEVESAVGAHPPAQSEAGEGPDTPRRQHKPDAK
ncbi:MAG: benzoate-CoA ligase family protein, partial [Sandaracinaceae bacterium]